MWGDPASHHATLCARSIRCFLSKSNLLFSSVTSDLRLAVSPLYFHSWWCLLIVDCDDDTPISRRVFFTWLHVVKGFSSPERNTVIIHFRWLLWSFRPFDVAELTSVFVLFENVADCWFSHSCSFCYLSDEFIFYILLMMASFTCADISFWPLRNDVLDVHSWFFEKASD